MHPKEKQSSKCVLRSLLNMSTDSSPPQILWQAIPDAGGIITKGCLSMPLGPRLWDR
jgi:hypothetical protein